MTAEQLLLTHRRIDDLSEPCKQTQAIDGRTTPAIKCGHQKPGVWSYSALRNKPNNYR